MARKIVKYLDSRGHEHTGEAQADRADLRYKVEEILARHCVDDSINLESLEGSNREHLQPLIDYFEMLAKESDERTRRFG